MRTCSGFSSDPKLSILLSVRFDIGFWLNKLALRWLAYFARRLTVSSGN